MQGAGLRGTGQKFYLFDTFEGRPIERMSEIERGQASANNSNYFDLYETTKSHFSEFPNVVMVRGVLPESLARVTIDRTCYLSIDLNYAAVEIASIDALWSRMSPGAVIVLDDHAWHCHHPQKEAWDIWAREKGTAVFTVPTGQGLIVK